MNDAAGTICQALRGGGTPLPIEVRERLQESMFPNPGMACRRTIELTR